ncbi:hypothetical protein ACLKA7_014915 [Drosophila subpalustris]
MSCTELANGTETDVCFGNLKLIAAANNKRLWRLLAVAAWPKKGPKGSRLMLELELQFKAVRGSLVFSTRVNFLHPYLQTQSEACPSRKIGGGGIRFETQPPFATHAH